MPWLASAPDPPTNQISPVLVEQLANSLKTSQLLTPDSEGYADGIKRWSDAVEKEAAIIVYATSTKDISTTITFCRAHAIPFAVSGGRHSSNGASSISGGLVIDLRKFNKVIVDTSNKTVTAQGGAVWRDVDEAAGEHDLAAVGGTVNHTGVGGLTLGGGYGWLSGQYGLTIDNLLSCTMVLADGSVEKASESENPGLFWAVRGAGQCFGVAADLTFRAHDQKNQIWAGQMVFPADERLEAIVEFGNSLVATTDGNSALIMGITAPPFLKGPAAITTVFYNGAKEEAEKLFAPLIALNPIKNTTAEMPYCKMNGVMNHAVDYGGRKLSKGASFVTPLRPSFVRDLVDELRHFHHEVEGTRKTILLFEFFNTAQWCKIPKTAMSFANRGNHQNAMIGPFWSDEASDSACRRWARHMAQQFNTELELVRKERGLEEIGEYGNYDGLLASPRRIFGANYDRLTELKAKFDPDNVFDKSYSLYVGDSGLI